MLHKTKRYLPAFVLILGLSYGLEPALLSGPVTRLARIPQTAVVGNALPQVRRWYSEVLTDNWSADATIDTGSIKAFDIAADTTGRIWAAVAHPNGDVRLLSSDDDGRTWNGRFVIQPGSPVTRLKLVPAQGDSGFVFLFLLEQSGDGDLWLLRLSGDTLPGVLPAAVGPDTIDDFSAVCDRDSDYYLYCIYANEHRGGRTGAFIRSVDFGRTWGSATDWWNGWDPRLSYTSGSTIHCAWRYAATGTQIHYTNNRHYGAAGYWSWLRVLSWGGNKCWDPVIVQADTEPEWRNPVWLFYTIGRRDTSQRDLMYAYSLDNGGGWSTAHSFSDPFVDEWAADLQFDAGRNGGFLGLCYNYGGGRSGDSATVYLRLGSTGDSTYWTHPLAVNAEPASLGSDGVGPRLVYTRTGIARPPAVAYCRRSEVGASGLYLAAPWLARTARASTLEHGVTCAPNPAFGRVTVSFAVARSGQYTLDVYDAAGTRVSRLFSGTAPVGTLRCNWDGRRHPAGTYFIQLVGPAGMARARLTLLNDKKRL